MNGVIFPETPVIIPLQRQENRDAAGGMSRIRPRRRRMDGRERRGHNKKVPTMGRVLRAILVVIVIGLLGVAGFAYLGDMSPQPAQQRLPVNLDDTE